MSLVHNILKNNLSIRGKTKGSSMLPFIRTGDYVIVKPIRAEDAKIGDIIAYSYNGQDALTCHRLIKILDSLFITKGDTQIRGYERITPSSILGRVIFIERNKNKINLQSGLHRFMSVQIAWISLHIPLLLLTIAYLLEAFRAPHLAPTKLIRKIRRINLRYN